MKAIAEFIAALIRAIFGVLTYPLRVLGFEPKLRAADVAEAAVAAVRADPIPHVVPTPKEPTPMADLVLQHARKRLFTHERHEGLVPLPAPIEAWIERLDGAQLADIIGCQGTRLQRHINAGLGGSTALGPHHLPAVVPGAVPMPVKAGATGGTTATRSQDLSAVLDELGLVFEQSYRPSPL